MMLRSATELPNANCGHAPEISWRLRSLHSRDSRLRVLWKFNAKPPLWSRKSENPPGYSFTAAISCNVTLGASGLTVRLLRWVCPA